MALERKFHLSLFLLCLIAVFCDAGSWADLSLKSFSPVRRGRLQLGTLPFEYRQTVPLSVSAQCGESTIVVQVKTDLFGTGQLINASDLRLGDCAVTRQDTAAQLLIFEAELQACGSELMMLADQLVYTFSLLYKPTALSSSPIVRTSPASVGIECHYTRLHNVSSNALKPTWVPFASTMSAAGLLNFSLVLMNDDWTSPRSSMVFYLGDILNIEASVTQADHQPLRLFVDSCVATLVPDKNSVPRYDFIENHGCLTDAKATGSNSRFRPRSQDPTKLQMQLDAFRFHMDTRNMIYITCHLKVVDTSQNIDPMNKACFFASGARWTSVDGSDQVCACCDTGSCGRRRRSLPLYAKREWEGDAVIGPITVQEEDPALLGPEAHNLLGLKEQRSKGSSTVVALAVVATALGVVSVAVIGVGVHRRRNRFMI
ncbi:ZP3 protein, partial [Atractosteus spatula]|nr:ZP3 protein [Atractosteus spatula]